MKVFRSILVSFFMLALSSNLVAASNNAPLKAKGKDMTSLITNPSFETGDETGWTLVARGDNDAEIDRFVDEFATKNYTMTNKDGSYLMNAYQWWATSLTVYQTIENVPSGVYELSAVVATWEGRTVTFSGNDVQTTIEGQGDQVGIPVSLTVRIGAERQLTIKCESTGRWWESGHENETQTFFKLDKVRLTCSEFTIDVQAKTLPNDDKTILTADQWYKYSLSYPGDYWMVGDLSGLEYTTDGDKLISEAQMQNAARLIKVSAHNIYVHTTKNTTLRLASANTMSGNTFTAVALNVDGLPQELNFLVKKIELNPDGPGQDGTLKISQYLAGKNYDIIGCSEDFNYNNALMESLKDNYSCGTIRAKLNASDIDYGKLIQRKVRFDTDGLNLIWKKSRIIAENESWTKWDSTANTDGNEYVKKGFRHYDIAVDEVADIDLYVLHMDAGNEEDATWSREIQWRQLADAINDGSNHDKPKLIIGDTNSRWTREDIISCFMNRLSPDFTMGDAWVEFGRGGVYPTTAMDHLTDKTDPTDYSRYEIVDKIIYINPRAANSLQLKPTSFLIEQDYTYGHIDGTDDTTPLGDHNPTVSKIRYTQSTGIAPLAVSLSEIDNNDKTLENVQGAISNVTLRSFYFNHNNVWRTLCLPFDVADLTGTPFEGAVLKELDTTGEYDGHYTGLDGSVLYLFFKDATRIVAGRPYLVKWEGGTSVSGAVFNNVNTITQPGKIDAADASVSMLGSFSPVTFNADDNSIVYLDTEGNPVSPTKRTTMTSCRAYFKLAADVEPESVVIGFSDYSDGIGEITNTQSSNDTLYDLSGRKVNRTAKGMYIQNGRVVVVK